VLLLVLVCVLFEHKVVESNKVEYTLLEVDHEQVVVVRSRLRLRLILEIQTYQNVVNGASCHYYNHQDKEKIHLTNDH
jgi:hypothetical protein